VTRQSRRGPFVGCSGYPECTYTKDSGAKESTAKGSAAASGADADGAAPEELGACPECGKPLARKRGRRGAFVGCSGYPGCRYIQPGSAGTSREPATPEPTGESCPECGKPLVRRQGRYGPFVSCSGYPACRYRPPRGAEKREPSEAMA
jgi:DNA topoisomerase-1